MYQAGGSKLGASTGVGLGATGTTLASTGFPALGIAILAVLAVVVGLVLVRAAAMRRARRSGASS
jgi:hypothetical protein